MCWCVRWTLPHPHSDAVIDSAVKVPLVEPSWPKHADPSPSSASTATSASPSSFGWGQWSGVLQSTKHKKWVSVHPPERGSIAKTRLGERFGFFQMAADQMNWLRKQRPLSRNELSAISEYVWTAFRATINQFKLKSVDYSQHVMQFFLPLKAFCPEDDHYQPHLCPRPHSQSRKNGTATSLPWVISYEGMWKGTRKLRNSTVNRTKWLLRFHESSETPRLADSASPFSLRSGQ